MGRISFGIIILFAGLILLLEMLHIIEFSWLGIIKYAPLLIVIAGINILMPKTAFGRLGTALLTIAILIVVFISGLQSESFQEPNIAGISDSNQSGNSSSATWNGHTKTANLSLNFGANSIVLDSTPTNQLIQVNNQSQNQRIKLKADYVSEEHVDIVVEGKSFSEKNQSKSNKTSIQLHTSPIWNIHFNCGASAVKFDLSPYQIQDISVNAGAASMDLKLGKPSRKSTIELNSGASSLSISIPKDVAVRVDSKTFLSSISAKGLPKLSKKRYESSNYSSSAYSYNIQVKGAATSLTINRY